MAAHEKIYGRKACLAVLRHRMDDVVRIAHGERLRRDLGPLLREAAARRIPYAEIADEGLERLAESIHHEGLVLIVRPRRWLDRHELYDRVVQCDRFALLALDGVTNPHNVGAIVRTAAFLGVDAVAVRAPADRAPLTPAALRIAEGAAESIAIACVPDLDVFLGALRRERVAVLGADMQGEEDALTMRWPARTALVLGNEGEGLSREVEEQLDRRVAIRGTGAVESLNVSVAAGIVLAAWTSSDRRR